MSGRGTLVLAGAIAVALTGVLVGVALALGSSPAASGSVGTGRAPLQLPGDAYILTSSNLTEAGRTLSDGLLTVKNMGSEPVVLEKARLLGGERGIVLVGALILRTPTGAAMTVRPGFDRSEGTRLEGALVPPEAEVQVVWGVKLLRPGRFTSQGLELQYRVGDRRFVGRYPSPLRLCAPAEQFVNRCPLPVPSGSGG